MPQLEYAQDGIRVNAIGPGYIDTPLLKMLEKPVYEGLVDLHPLGRLGRAEELAVFLGPIGLVRYRQLPPRR
jgi:NAD(P)-dependent dehydrogenase (short-subunit alcohol dehydrogenase family)